MIDLFRHRNEFFFYSNSITRIHKEESAIFSIPFWYENTAFCLHEKPYTVISLIKKTNKQNQTTTHILNVFIKVDSVCEHDYMELREQKSEPQPTGMQFMHNFQEPA